MYSERNICSWPSSGPGPRRCWRASRRKRRNFTVDARLTQRSLTKALVEGHGDYVMVVKAHQPGLRRAIKFVFTEPPEDAVQPTVALSLVGLAPDNHRPCTSVYPA